MEKWIEFYTPVFATGEEATAFVAELEQLTPDSPRHRAKIMMHQVQRMVSLADDVGDIRPGRESLQLLFLLVCAENTAKLFHGFASEGHSRAFTRRFFEEFLSPEDRHTLEHAFVTLDHKPLDLRQAVDCLYDVRCDVVHEGQYWGFNFKSGDTPMLNAEPAVTALISLAEFRLLLVRSAIRAVRNYAP